MRIADLLCGFVGRIIRAMEKNYQYKDEEYQQRKLLDIQWFQFSDKQFELYKKIANIFFTLNNNYYMSYAGVYGDEISSFFMLFRYFDEYSTYEDFSKTDSKLHTEYFNTYLCKNVAQEYQRFVKLDCLR